MHTVYTNRNIIIIINHSSKAETGREALNRGGRVGVWGGVGEPHGEGLSRDV